MNFPELPKGYRWRVYVRKQFIVGDTVYVEIIGRVFKKAESHCSWDNAEHDGETYEGLLERLAKLTHARFLADRAEPMAQAQRRRIASEYEAELNEAAHP